MEWLLNLFSAGGKVVLDPAQQARLDAWHALPEPDLQTPIEASRYVVVDVESSGLNIKKDKLIAIGAVAVEAGRIALGDSLEMVLQQDRISSKDNILIHGIGGTAQLDGIPPIEALLRFLEYLGKSPLVAFHAAFDEAMISGALRRFLGLRFKHTWTDLAYVSPALYPQLALRNRSLDHWMTHFGISNYARHSALADALATAELLLALRTRMRDRSVKNLRDIRALENMHRRISTPG